MPVSINGSTGITNVDGSAGTPAEKGSTSATAGMFFPAANTVAFSTSSTEAMRVDSSQNVGIGTASPGTISGTPIRLDVQNSSANCFLRVKSTTTNTIALIDIDGGPTNGAGYLRFLTNGTEACRINNNSSNDMLFSTTSAATERMRLDSSGNLLVGTTSATNNSRLKVQGSSTSSADYMAQFTDSAGANAIYIKNDRSVFSDGIYNSTTASAANVFINGSAQLQRSTSSLKYKTDVKDATHGLTELLTLRPVTYKGKNDGDTIFGGLIAEEVHAAGLTEFVQYAEDGSPDALAYGNMVSLCIKAIQEQQAQIEELKAKVAALEAK